jgi:hypothetical protein
MIFALIVNFVDDVSEKQVGTTCRMTAGLTDSFMNSSSSLRTVAYLRLENDDCIAATTARQRE